MKYILDKKSGNEISILGLGCMRFPRSFAETEKMVVKAVEEGINFFDTAYIYGKSEEILGKIVEKNNLRDKMFIATKLPLIFIKKREDFDTYFDKQLARLRTNYIDYYMMHCITDFEQWNLFREMGMEDWIKEKLDSGQIKNIGFSFHGPKQDFIKIVDSYDWGFTLVQYNYSDPNYQAGIEGIKYAHSKDLLVLIMEPLLGGWLADSLPKEAVDLFKQTNKKYSPAGWAFRWLWNQKEVHVILSGTSNMRQLTENIEVANSSTPNMLSKKEQNAIKKAMNILNESYKIKCTGCGYCMPCPANVNIPGCFSAYNNSYALSYFTAVKDYAISTGIIGKQSGRAKQCTKCGKCEPLCPQNIKIEEELPKVRKRMEPFWYGILVFFVSKFLGKKKEKTQ